MCAIYSYCLRKEFERTHCTRITEVRRLASSFVRRVSCKCVNGGGARANANHLDSKLNGAS